MSIRKAIDLAGGTHASLGALLGISGEAVRKFTHKGVPAERVIPICEIVNWKVTPHELRPDIYPIPTDGIPPEVLQSKAA